MAENQTIREVMTPGLDTNGRLCGILTERDPDSALADISAARPNT